MLDIQNLHAGVDDKNILKGISLKVNAGEIHAIMGPMELEKAPLPQSLQAKKSFRLPKEP
jgi:Fe-S cluster assembly ATP-binding protein